ncbi:Type IV secretion system protein virB8 [Pseudomonas fluorescens]|nr:Type IV secretion system protein virB8 [Pseudomonas fluorescens]
MLKKEAARLMKEGLDFEKSKSGMQKKAMQVAFGIAGVSLVLNVALGVAVAALSPLKTVEPYLLEVRTEANLTNVTVRKPFEKPVDSLGEQVDKYFISDYIRARESYDWGMVQRMYDTVKSYSPTNGSVFNEYDKFMKSTQSPVVILADKARVVAEITSITLDEKTSTATVRITKTVMGQDGRPSVTIPVTYWIATLRYEYPNPKLKPEQRRLNPMGMQVPSYQLVQEQGRG